MSKIPGFRSGKTWKKVVASIVYLCVILTIWGMVKNGKNNNTPSTPTTAPVNQSNTAQSSSTSPTSAPEQAKPAPMVITADKLMEDLKSNALNASNNYKGKYVEVTGKLSNIDSNGEYFDITPMNDEFAIIGVQCYITEEQKATVAKFTKDQKVTVIGTISDVGEILGYSLKVESIK
ncbi:hypothetical protein REC12_15555 [Desulfosporosinus sp. PR]|uniref:OB-fold protein n=1 Tax=Candidatus Desulfosporosinus nitrosoreducens TaxID=3401928 RepID=UPI0027FD64AC|nr:hypothetical protein [Desulfosporosinus sp. PR]MDQ7095012.1 hypothetical protein [Desulfosporosinus sp. PR]